MYILHIFPEIFSEKTCLFKLPYKITLWSLILILDLKERIAWIIDDRSCQCSPINSDTKIHVESCGFIITLHPWYRVISRNKSYQTRSDLSEAASNTYSVAFMQYNIHNPQTLNTIYSWKMELAYIVKRTLT